MVRILTILVLLLVTQPDTWGEQYDVYLLAGQSNMDGRGRVSELPDELSGPIDDAIIYYRNAKQNSRGWQTLRPGFSVPPKYSGELPSPTFGPEITFAESMIDSVAKRKLAIIKGSQGGTNLRMDWNAGVQGDANGQGTQYRDFIETIQMATEDLSQRGDEYVIRGMLWHQGESDRKSDAAVHARRLKHLIAQIRTKTGIADLPVVLGEVFDNGQRDSVRTALRAVADADANIGLVSSDGTTTSDPGTHFDTPSQLELGRRYARVLKRLPAWKPTSAIPK